MSVFLFLPRIFVQAFFSITGFFEHSIVPFVAFLNIRTFTLWILSLPLSLRILRRRGKFFLVTRNFFLFRNFSLTCGVYLILLRFGKFKKFADLNLSCLLLRRLLSILVLRVSVVFPGEQSDVLAEDGQDPGLGLRFGLGPLLALPGRIIKTGVKTFIFPLGLFWHFIGQLLYKMQKSPAILAGVGVGCE